MADSNFSHVALLVPSVETSAQFLNSRGIETCAPESFEAEGTKEIYVGSYDKRSALLLLLEAISDGPYQNAMRKRGPSLHHLAIDVLDVERFVQSAQNIGWALHPASARTLSYKTAWLYLKGVPTLIEVHQKKDLSSKPAQVSKLALPIQEEHLPLFDGIGLGDVISCAGEIKLTVEGRVLTFREIAYEFPHRMPSFVP